MALLSHPYPSDRVFITVSRSTDSGKEASDLSREVLGATMSPEQVESFGQEVPLKRAGQPAELAPVYVLLASDQGSHISGARYAVTGGRPVI